ncbi:DUF2059 domain-containing protein [Aurantiacibacter sediminis]|uniref:DUF2059 domain-containing protein n=1 Tax=Aurantiacibacter sediminis TaxID=2793064 RepID=A0ABS0N1A1_9SPHN|nr:DUF2059 domain-containing protein [Aurantiacibacter sediminis]MBH5321507.1 DUF2059 domain-containing protein [Aurantiacibacter sediminis]
MANGLLSAGAALALACICAPAAAQDAMEDAAGNAADMDWADADAMAFPMEVMTPEQMARIPSATRVVELLIAENGMASLTGGVFENLFGEVDPEDYGEISPMNAINEALSFGYYNEELPPSKAERALAILDPHWRARQEAERTAMVSYMERMRAATEPAMRQAMIEIYAMRFTEDQLREIEAFFGTEAGLVLAREAMSMSSDPRVYNAMMTSPWFDEEEMSVEYAVMERLRAELPARPIHAELSERDRGHLAALLGVSEARLQDMMEAREAYDAAIANEEATGEASE